MELHGARLAGGCGTEATAGIDSASGSAITAEDAHTHTAKERQVHECDFRAGSVFRSIHFPRPVDVNRATAEFHDGMLTVKAPIVTEAASKRLDVKVA